jgi:hypothetical protein
MSIAWRTLGQAMTAASKGDPVKPVALSGSSSAKMWESRRWSGCVALSGPLERWFAVLYGLGTVDHLSDGFRERFEAQ